MLKIMNASLQDISSGSNTHTKDSVSGSVQTALLLGLVHVSVTITLESLTTPVEGYSTAPEGPGGGEAGGIAFLQQRATQAPGMLLCPPRD